MCIKYPSEKMSFRMETFGVMIAIFKIFLIKFFGKIGKKISTNNSSVAHFPKLEIFSYLSHEHTHTQTSSRAHTNTHTLSTNPPPKF